VIRVIERASVEDCINDIIYTYQCVNSGLKDIEEAIDTIRSVRMHAWDIGNKSLMEYTNKWYKNLTKIYIRMDRVLTDFEKNLE
jgi:hypothetical protein